MMFKSKVKYIQSLSQKKQRDQDGVFVAEGPKMINELLHTPGIEAVEIFGIKEWLATRTDAGSSQFTEIDPPTLEKVSFLSTPNQVIGIFRKPGYLSAALSEPVRLSGQVSLMLHSIQDPGNMGSIIRCADWFGVSQVICSKDCADVFGPKTVQSTMGSIARVKIIYEDIEQLILRELPVRVYAATLGGKSLHELEPLQEGGIIIGNESKGIDPSILKLVKQHITIPRKGQAESLNAAVATGIILSYLIR